MDFIVIEEKLKWHDYVSLALRTESKPIFDHPKMANVMRLNHGFTGLVTEYAELVAATSTEHMTLIEHRDEEIGDLAWYTAVMWDALGLGQAQIIPYPRSLRAYEDELLGQIASIGNVLKRTIYYGMALNEEEAAKNVRVIQSTISALGGYAFETILAKNIKKLKLRFPDRFDADRAVNRDLAAEAGTIRR